MQRDGRVMMDDNVEIVIDTYHDRRKAYYFATNPAGALVDGRVVEGQRPSVDWDGIWTVRTHTFRATSGLVLQKRIRLWPSRRKSAS
jgi:hypothetical protein